MINQVIGIITGIAIGYIIGKSKPFESMKLRLLLSILFPIIIWILVTSVINDPDRWTTVIISDTERLAKSLGIALGRFFFGYIALGITIFSMQSKNIKKANEQTEFNDKANN